MREGIEEKSLICQKNYYDYDTGECRLPNELKGTQCKIHPRCMYKVNDPL